MTCEAGVDEQVEECDGQSDWESVGGSGSVLRGLIEADEEITYGGDGWKSADESACATAESLGRVGC